MWGKFRVILCVVALYAFNTAVASETDQGVVKSAYVPLDLRADSVNGPLGFLSLPRDITFEISKVWTLSDVSRLAASNDSGNVNVVFVMSPEAAQALFQTPQFRVSSQVRPKIHVPNPLPGGLEEEAVVSKPNSVSRTLQGIIENRATILKRYASDPLVLKAVKTANAQPESLDEIHRRDRAWCEGTDSDFVEKTLDSSASRFLRRKVKSNKLLYTEAFLCDQQGRTVGAYPRTSDYFQGDEDKFVKCYDEGKGNTVTGPLEFDKSTQTHSVQISIPVMQTGECIGVLIMGLRNIR